MSKLYKVVLMLSLVTTASVAVATTATSSSTTDIHGNSTFFQEHKTNATLSMMTSENARVTNDASGQLETQRPLDATTRGNETDETSGGSKQDGTKQLNPVIIIMIAILVFLTTISVAGGLFVLLSRPQATEGHSALIESPSEVNVSTSHLYQRNSIMGMFEPTNQEEDASRPRPHFEASGKIGPAFLTIPIASHSTSATNAGAHHNIIGYDDGCDA